MALPQPVMDALDKIDVFMAKYPTLSQYGKMEEFGTSMIDVSTQSRQWNIRECFDDGVLLCLSLHLQRRFGIWQCRNDYWLFTVYIDTNRNQQ